MFKVLSCAALALFLLGCGSNQLRQSPDSAMNKQAQSEKTITQENAKTFYFVDDKGKKLSLSSNDDFNTAVLKDDSGKSYDLKRERAADGIYMENKDGVSIHFKKGEGIVEFSKYKSIPITEVK